MNHAQLTRRAHVLAERFLLAPEELELVQPFIGRTETYDVGDGTELMFVFGDDTLALPNTPQEVYLNVYGYQRMSEQVTLPLGRDAAERLYGLAVVQS